MRTKIKELLHAKDPKSFIGKEVNLAGWIRTVRDQKSFAFIEINDGSTLGNLQVIAEASMAGYAELTPKLTTGASLAVRGLLVESPGKNQALELQAKEIRILGLCDPAAIRCKKNGIRYEFLRTIAHLRPRTNTQGAVLRVRSALAFATHLFFHQRGFLYIPHTSHHRIRLRGRWGDVPRDHARKTGRSR